MRQIERKFGAPSQAVRDRIASADADTLLHWTTFENVPTGMRWTGTLGASADGQTRTWRDACVTYDRDQASTWADEGPLLV